MIFSSLNGVAHSGARRLRVNMCSDLGPSSREREVSSLVLHSAAPIRLLVEQCAAGPTKSDSVQKGNLRTDLLAPTRPATIIVISP
jgi:hypothetical protein